MESDEVTAMLSELRTEQRAVNSSLNRLHGAVSDLKQRVEASERAFIRSRAWLAGIATAGTVAGILLSAVWAVAKSLITSGIAA